MHVLGMIAYRDDSGRALYVRVIRALIRSGARVAPRGFPTIEVRPAHLILTHPQDPVPTGVGRRWLRPVIGITEGLQLVAGVSRPELLTRITPRFAEFIENGRLHGAYGPRVRAHVHRVIELLTEEPDSRQGVVTIWNNHSDHKPWSRGSSGSRPKDIPCTVSLHFFVRDGALELHVHMRSNDAWLGLPYDMTQFAILQCSVANTLGRRVGDYHHHADSLHLYERDLGWACKIRPVATFAEECELANASRQTGVGHTDQPWAEIVRRARTLLDGGIPDDPTPTEQTFADELAKYA